MYKQCYTALSAIARLPSIKCSLQDSYLPIQRRTVLCPVVPELTFNWQSARRGHVRFPYILLTIQEALCLFGCHDYIAACTGARALNACALNISCLRPHHIQHLLYYCAFIWVTLNICVRGGTAKGHRAKRRSWR